MEIVLIGIAIMWIVGALVTFGGMSILVMINSILMSKPIKVPMLILLSLGWPIWLLRAIFFRRKVR